MVKKIIIAPSIQKVLVDSKYKTAKSMKDMEKIVFRDMLQKTKSYNRIPTKERLAGRDNYINDLDNDERKILKLDTKFSGKEIEEVSYHLPKLTSTLDLKLY